MSALHLSLFSQPEMEQIAEHLFEQAPSLRVLSIHSRRCMHTLDIPPAFLGGSFPSLRTLFMEGISSFSGPHTFPSVTSLTLNTNSDVPLDTASLLNALERLPSLETVFIEFRAWAAPLSITGDRTVTLQNLREMSLLSKNDTRNACMGPILSRLHLPKLERLEVYSDSTLESHGPCFPLSFTNQLPNFSELPEATIIIDSSWCSVHFQGERQHALGISIGQPSSFEETRELLGGLPLRSVRSLTVGFTERSDREFLFGLLGAMDGVKDLVVRGDWTLLLRFWREGRERKRHCPALRKLTVHGEEGSEPELGAFEDARRDVGLPLTATYVLRVEGD